MKTKRTLKRIIKREREKDSTGETEKLRVTEKERIG